MTTLPERILTRYAAVVVPFKPRPGVPVEVIGGRRYVLSTDGGPLGDSEDPTSGWLGDARLIQTPPHSNKWRFLWIYDTEKKFVSMFRVADGNEKVSGAATHFTAQILRLEKKGQLNRVTHLEFQVVEREMLRRQERVEADIQQIIDAHKTEYQRKIDKFSAEYFEKVVVPRIERALNGIQQGAIPFGFQPFGHNVPDDMERQKATYVIGQVLRQELTEPKLGAYLAHHGINPNDPNEDSQAVYWAIGDLQDLAYTRFMPSR